MLIGCLSLERRVSIASLKLQVSVNVFERSRYKKSILYLCISPERVSRVQVIGGSNPLGSEILNFDMDTPPFLIVPKSYVLRDDVSKNTKDLMYSLVTQKSFQSLLTTMNVSLERCVSSVQQFQMVGCRQKDKKWSRRDCIEDRAPLSRALHCLVPPVMQLVLQPTPCCPTRPRQNTVNLLQD